jgi:hypothetical protein
MTENVITLAFALASDNFNQSRLAELLETRITDDLEQQMLAALPRTDDPRLRNIIALKIAEDGSPVGKQTSVPILKKLLEEPRTNGCRGTLLYALHEMREPLPLAFLLDQIAGSNISYEVQSEVFEIIQENMSRFSSQEIKSSFRLVENVNLQENECMHDILEILNEELAERAGARLT